MWTRKEVKEQGRGAMMANYWKTVLVGLISALVVSGAAAGGSSAGGRITNHYGNHGAQSAAPAAGVLGGSEGLLDEFEEIGEELEDGVIRPSEAAQRVEEALEDADVNGAGVASVMAVLLPVIGAVILFAMVIAFLAWVIGSLVDIFLRNPLEVGVRRFYVQNLHQPARVGELMHAFDRDYLEKVKTMFLRDLYVFLWSLLFIIPGIIKSYEYMMVPYLLADNDGMSAQEAFDESRRLMTGQKWNAFVLDLSFIGWRILSAFTFGLLNIFYVNPYADMTHAALYERLRYGQAQGAEMYMN